MLPFSHMAQNDGRVQVGSAPFPFAAVGIAVGLLVVILLGVAYVSRTPYGAEVSAPPEVDAAVNEHLAKNSARFPLRRIYYNCEAFIESVFSSDQNFAIAIEQGNWRPGVQPVQGIGNLEIVKASRKGTEPWQISSVSIPNASFDPSAIPPDSPRHPCNVK